MTPMQLMSVTSLFGEKALLDDLDKVLKYYSQWDEDQYEFFDQYLAEDLDENRLGHLWRYLEFSGICIRSTGHEFVLNK